MKIPEFQPAPRTPVRVRHISGLLFWYTVWYTDRPHRVLITGSVILIIAMFFTR